MGMLFSAQAVWKYNSVLRCWNSSNEIKKWGQWELIIRDGYYMQVPSVLSKVNETSVTNQAKIPHVRF